MLLYNNILSYTLRGVEIRFKQKGIHLKVFAIWAKEKVTIAKSFECDMNVKHEDFIYLLDNLVEDLKKDVDKEINRKSK